METEFSGLLNIAERTPGLYFSYETNLTLRWTVFYVKLPTLPLSPHEKQEEEVGLHYIWLEIVLVIMIKNLCNCSAQRLHDLGDESKLLPLWRQVICSNWLTFIINFLWSVLSLTMEDWNWSFFFIVSKVMYKWWFHISMFYAWSSWFQSHISKCFATGRA